MKEDTIIKAATQFGKGIPIIESLGEGLIHRTFKVTFTGNENAIVLQCINQRTFSLPENIIQNYLLVLEFVENESTFIKLPALMPTLQNKFFWVDEKENFWRATKFIENSYSLSVATNEKDAFRVARCFAEFTRALTGLRPADLNIIIPHFHNLELRYQQFEEAIGKANITRLLRSTHVISELRQRKSLIQFYEELNNEADYPTRVMHHDCKIDNILFDKITNAVICPVDLDTVMPGKFFSDIGDMIRTMVCPVNENSTVWEDISMRSDFYESIVSGYLDGIGNSLTAKEKEHIHYCGLIMIYMQSIRFVTDFLNYDIYYKIDYSEQNLNRALNQFLLLEKLEEYLHRKYGFTSYH